MRDMLQEVVETIKINGNICTQNKELTIEYLSSDFLNALGYNKKRDSGVRRITDDVVDWAIYDTDTMEPKLCIVVRGLRGQVALTEQDIHNIMYNDSFKMFPIIVATDFERCLIYVLSESKKQITVANISTNENIEHLEWVSKNGYNLAALVGYYQNYTETSELEQVTAERNSLRNRVVTLTTELDSAYEEVQQLKKELMARPVIASSNSAVEEPKLNTGVSSVSWSKKEEEYRERIEKEIGVNEELKATVVNLKRELAIARSQNEGQEGSHKRIMEEILDAQEDEPNAPRKYMAVVGMKLKQKESITKFIGACLTELYSEVGFDLMSALYDGDCFRYKSDVKSVDFIINSKRYEIDTTGQNEAELLGKLQSVMDKFEDRVLFMQKTTGKAPEEEVQVEDGVHTEHGDIAVDDGVEHSDMVGALGISQSGVSESTKHFEAAMVESEDDFFGEESAESDQINFEIPVEAEEISEPALLESVVEPTNNTENTDEISLSVPESIPGNEIGPMMELASESLPESKPIDAEEVSDESHIKDLAQNEYIVVNIVNIGEIVWNEDVKLKSLAMVEVGERNDQYIYEINVDDPDNLNKVTAKCVDAILAGTGDMVTAIDAMKTMKFSEISSFIIPGSPKTRGLPRLSISSYVIDGIKSFQQMVPILSSMCKMMGVKCKIYFKGDIAKKGYLQKYIVNEPIHLPVNSEILESGWQDRVENDLAEKPLKSGVVKGFIIQRSILTRNNFAVQSQLIDSISAVKFTDYSATIDTPDKIYEAVASMIEKRETRAAQQGETLSYETLARDMGKIIESPYPILTARADQAGPEVISVSFGESEYFMTLQEPWRNVYSLFKMHNILLSNYDISLRINLNPYVYRYYTEQFVTTNPTLKVTIEALIANIRVN